MGITKNALVRYRILDRCLRDTSRVYSAKDLLGKVNDGLRGLLGDGAPRSSIGKVQLHTDLEALREHWDADILESKSPSDGRVLLYRYSDPNFSINNQPLSEVEASNIRDAIEVLSRFQGLPQFEHMSEIIPALEDRFGTRSEKRESAIEFSSNKYLEGLEHLTPAHNAIVNQRVLSVEYQDFKSPTPYTVELHPYYLKQFNNRWFLFGRNPSKGSESWNLSLDRIKSIQETTTEFISTTIDWSEYFEDIVGVSKHDKDVEVVELLFSPEQAPYVLTKPLHGSQKTKSNDENGLLISLEVIPNYELLKLILSFGPKVEVISPQEIRRQIASMVETCSRQY